MQDIIFAYNLDEHEVAKIIRTYPAYGGLESQIGTLLNVNSLDDESTYQAITSQGNFVIRFPHNLKDYALLKKEEKVQIGFRSWVNLKIPETRVYDEVYGCPVFAVHALIPGEPLDSKLYESMSPGARYRLITDLANFFNQSHRVPLTLACEWLNIKSWGESTAEALAPMYGKPAWFEPKAVTLIGLALSTVLEVNQINLFNETVVLFEGLDTDAHNLVFGHGDLHGYNMAMETDELGPKLSGVFDLGCTGILDAHEDFFRLSLISEDLLERVIYIYQNFSNPKRLLNRQRLAIYYRAFLFYLMAEQVEGNLQPLVDLLAKHVEYYHRSYGELR
jgi:aminoglycoside phosphotransferase (APT) family kinase protein